jgi:hypothetical protein
VADIGFAILSNVLNQLRHGGFYVVGKLLALYDVRRKAGVRVWREYDLQITYLNIVGDEGADGAVALGRSNNSNRHLALRMPKQIEDWPRSVLSFTTH